MVESILNMYREKLVTGEEALSAIKKVPFYTEVLKVYE
jgi:hypothetical protein